MSVSDPLPVQPLTVKVLPPAVSVRLAVVNPLKVNVGPPVTASDVFARTTLLGHAVHQGLVEPLSVPLPVQPVTVKVCVLPLSVRLAVVIPLKLSVVLGAVNRALASVKEPLAESVIVPVPAGADSDPVPVQPLTCEGITRSH